MLRIAMVAIAMALAGCVSNQPREFTVFFETDDAAMTPEAQKVVVQIAAAARDAHPAKIVVEGQADGGTTHDAALADGRADTVLHALADAGVDANSINKKPSAPLPGTVGVAAHKVKVTLIP